VAYDCTKSNTLLFFLKKKHELRTGAPLRLTCECESESANGCGASASGCANECASVIESESGASDDEASANASVNASGCGCGSSDSAPPCRRRSRSYQPDEHLTHTTTKRVVLSRNRGAVLQGIITWRKNAGATKIVLFGFGAVMISARRSRTTTTSEERATMTVVFKTGSTREQESLTENRGRTES
jgi:hypothetical protein